MPSGQEPEFTPNIYGDLRDHLRAKDRDRAIELYYKLLSSGRPLSEIIASGVLSTDTLEESSPDQPTMPPLASTAAVPQLGPAPDSIHSLDSFTEGTTLSELRSIPELLSGRAAAFCKDDGATDILGSNKRPEAADDTSPERYSMTTSSEQVGRNRLLSLSLPGSVWRASLLSLFCLGCGAGLGLVSVVGMPFVHHIFMPFGPHNLKSETAINDAQVGSGNQMPQVIASASKPRIVAASAIASQINPAAGPGETQDLPKETDLAARRLGTVPAGPTPNEQAPPRGPASLSDPELQPNSESGKQRAVPATVIATPAPNQALSPLQKDEIDTLLSRGDALFAAGDVTSARLFYRYGAEAGDATAAMRLGETFDPVFLQRANLAQARGDAITAVYWYRRAGELGNSDAKLLLNDIGSLEK